MEIFKMVVSNVAKLLILIVCSIMIVWGGLWVKNEFFIKKDLPYFVYNAKNGVSVKNLIIDEKGFMIAVFRDNEWKQVPVEVIVGVKAGKAMIVSGITNGEKIMK